MTTRNWKLEIGNWRGALRSSGFQFRISSFFARLGTRLAPVAVAAAVLAAPSAAYAQGCAMCYTSAEAAKAGAIQALRSGILILLVPTLLMFVAVAVVIFRRRNQFNEPAGWSEEHEHELREMLAQWQPVEGEEASVSSQAAFAADSRPLTKDR